MWNDTRQTSAWIECASQLLAAALRLRTSATHPDPRGLTVALSEALIRCNDLASAEGAPEPAWSCARLLICRRLDEAIASTAWGADDAAMHDLERRFGGAASDAQIVALVDGFHLLDFATGSLSFLVGPEPVAGTRLNDGKVGPDGRFWAGTMDEEQLTRPIAALYRLDPDHSLHRVVDGLIVSNGLAWTPDGSRAHYVDSATGRVDVLRTEGGRVVERTPFVEVDGTPDGLTVDAEGGVWVALFGGGAVHRYAHDGSLDAVVEVSASHPTSCAFGGPELDELWITTSQQDTGADGRSGALYRCLPGVRGVAPLPFRG